jgi:N6-L-threonylcarbamoyladenine synthase
MDSEKICLCNMKILGIETSCDETSASVIDAEKNDKTVKLLSNITASSLSLHQKTGGIIPEVAAREQLKYILPVIDDALGKAKEKIENIDAIAVTIGPGLIGSLLIGIETAKSVAKIYNKPIVPVNHLFGHIYANFITTNKQPLTTNASGVRSQESGVRSQQSEAVFPAIVLVVSGGHTDLLLMKSHKSFKWLGGTRDDAAGEAFDKIARLLNLPYPGGPSIESASKNGNSKAYKLPRPIIDSGDFDFSFSGLKTAVLREVKTIEELNNETVNNLAASAQQAIVDVLIKKTLDAVKKNNAKSILLSGGVAANETLREQFELEIKNLKLEIPLFVPEKWLCTDNAAMVATAAFFNLRPVEWKKITVNPEAYFD